MSKIKNMKMHLFYCLMQLLLECLETAYTVISKRTGKMIDGTFVKDK